MQIYLVGGAVRDQLLGLPFVDRDWVVVGATAEQMLEQGFEAVGADFPVFLHPETKEEYALARRERKTGQGYGGFSFDADTTVSLADDLLRRDLTINAMAQDADGLIIDPHGGRRDLASRTLRHVSPAFAEDPLRVLRVARFKARLHRLGFQVATETLELLSAMSASGELEALAAQRLWVEFAKGLAERSPEQFIALLIDCGALRALLPALADRLQHFDKGLADEGLADQGLPAASSGESRAALTVADSSSAALVAKALSYANDYSLSAEERWGLLCHVLGPHERAANLSLAPPSSLANPVIDTLGETIAAPKQARRLALASAALMPMILRARQLKPDYLLSLLEACDAFRQSCMLESLLRIANVIQAAARHSNQHNAAVPAAGVDNNEAANSHTMFLLDCKNVCAAIGAGQFVERGLQGAEIAEAIRSARKIALAELKRAG